MRSLKALLFATVVSELLFSLAPAAAGCLRYVAPGNYQYPPQWGSDSGVIIRGHVELWGAGGKATGRIFEVAHGTDLSKFDFRDGEKTDPKVDYKALADCGTSFAFSRIAFNGQDRFFGYNAEQLKANHIVNIPYYFFPIPREDRFYQKYSNEDQDQIDASLSAFEQVGLAAAKDFEDQLANFGISALPVVTVANLTGQLVAIDIEQKLCATDRGNCDDAPGNAATEIRQYGRYYAKAACSWINAVRKRHPQLIVILYTTPSVWGEYLESSYPEENACLQSALVWIARTPKNGGDSYQHTTGGVDKQVQSLCRISGGDRCILHQYSHRALIASNGPPEGCIPFHIDVERFFFVNEVTTATGKQYVRRLSERQADPDLIDSDINPPLKNCSR
jgi:hypothetical protein